jgi:hypothetical protein
MRNYVYAYFFSIQFLNAEMISASLTSRLAGDFLAGDFPLDALRLRLRALTVDAERLRERPLAGLAGDFPFFAGDFLAEAERERLRALTGAAAFRSLDFLIFDSLTPAVEANFVRASIEP